MRKRKTTTRILVKILALCMSVTPLFAAVALYEPFDYPVGGLIGAGGTTEVGFTGT